MITLKVSNRTLLNRIIKLVVRNSKRIFSIYFYRNILKWRKLKGKFKGERIFLIGNGPSINKTPLFLLKNEYTICFNRFNLMYERLNWIPNFYMVMDSHVGLDMQDEINKLITNTDYNFFPDISPDLKSFRKFIGDKENVYYFHGEPVKFSNHLPWVKNGNTVVFPAFQILKYLGFSEIYFCGVDANYILHKNSKIIEEKILKGKTTQVIKSEADDDPNHFDPRYFGKGRVYHQPDEYVVNKLFENMDTTYHQTKNSLTKIINVGYDSKIEIFEKKDFIEVLNYPKDRIEQIFEELVATFNFKCLDEFLKSVNYCNDINEWNTNKDINALKTDYAVQVIKDKIFETIPIGPFEGYIYFIQRNRI